MSNLFKSKFVLGLMVAAAVILSTGTASAAITSTLKLGSNNSQVKELQQGLNSKGFVVSTSGAGSVGSETNYFGSKTKTAVQAYQASKGLTADGIFGPASRASWTGTVSTNYPAGCTSSAGFSPITGVSCSTGVSTTLPAGCSSTAGFSSTTGQPCSGTTSQTGPVTASLSSNNPASSTLVDDQATANLANFTFSGSGTVTSVTLQRIGVSADTTPRNVYLFDGATRLTDAASVSNTGTVTFSAPAGIFTVNGTKTISVKADIGAGDGNTSTTSGQTVGMMLATFTAGGTTSTVNLSGNIHSIASATLATVSAGTVTPSGATLNPAPNVTVWQSTLTISNRDVWMKRLALRNIGSAPANAFANFKLYVNGVQVGTATGLDANGYVTFDMTSAPVNLISGSRVVRVDADIVSGASRTAHFSLRNAADVDFVDSSFGVNITPTLTPWEGSANTISGGSGGTLTIERDTTSPSGNVSEGTNDKVIGVFKLTAFGEPIKIENLRATFSGSDASVDSLRNGRIMIGNAQYGSTATLLEDNTGVGYTQYTLNYTVTPGTPVLLELRADIFDNDGTDDLSNGDTIIGTIAAGSSNAQKLDSLGSISAPNATTVPANQLTIAAASMSLTRNNTYATPQTVALPATAFKIGAWNLAGSSTEDVLLTTLSFDVDEVTNATFSEADLTSMYVVVKNGNTIVAQPSPLATVSATDNNYSINYTLLKNASLTVELYANLGSTVTNGDSFDTELAVTGTAMVSGLAVLAGDDNADGDIDAGEGVEGQTIVAGAATITATQDASTPVASIVHDNQTVTTAAFKFAAVTAGYNVTDLTFTLADATVVQSVELYDGATLVASKPGSGTVTFNGLNWNVPANQNKVLTVKLVLGSVGIGAGTSGASLVVTLDAFTASNSSTGVSALGTEANPAGNAMYAYAAVPTITSATLPSSLLAAGTQTLGQFTVGTNGSGTIGWNRMVFSITKTSAPTLGSFTLWNADSNSEIAGTATIVDTANAATCLATLLGCRVSFVPTVEQQISGATTYALKATVGGTLVDNDYVSTTIASPSVFAASNTYATQAALGGGFGTYAQAGATPSFIWSDVSASGHSTTTTDWSTDYKVKNLPLNAQNLTK